MPTRSPPRNLYVTLTSLTVLNEVYVARQTLVSTVTSAQRLLNVVRSM